MIPVKQAPEPGYFDEMIRQPGLAFLASHADREPKSLWTLAYEDLRRGYKSICAYYCQRIYTDGTVDHFMPKSKYQALAYEWSNYRLCCSRANSVKAAKVGLVDPFGVGPWWFSIAFPQCDVVLGQNLPDAMRENALFTIKALCLNAESLVEQRADMALQFRDGHVKLCFLKKYYPFLAIEIERQSAANGQVDEAGFRAFIASLFRQRESVNTLETKGKPCSR